MILQLDKQKLCFSQILNKSTKLNLINKLKNLKIISRTVNYNLNVEFDGRKS